MQSVKLWFCACFCALSGLVFGQTNTFPASGSVGIGTTDPTSSALLEVTSTTKGVLVPRMTKAQRDGILSPAVGLLIYQTNLTPGFYYFDGSGWTAISSKDATRTLNNLTTTAVNATLQPGTDNTIDLGSTAFSWKNLFVDGVGYLGSVKIGTFTGTPTAGHIRWTGTDFEGYNGVSWVSLTATGGGGGGGAATDLSNLSSTNINTDLKPQTDNMHDLGAFDKNWQNIYLSGSIQKGNAHALTITTNGNVIMGNTSRTDLELLTFSNYLIGTNAGKLINNSSSGNILMGYEAASLSTDIISGNVVIGNYAARSITGSNNCYIGTQSANLATTGDQNIGIGYLAGKSNTGSSNIMIGESSGSVNTGSNNIVLGALAGFQNTGNENIMVGNSAGKVNTAANNVFIGTSAGEDNTTGTYNVFLGKLAGSENLTGNYNVVLGSQSIAGAQLGSYNTVSGYSVGYGTGSYNTIQGAFAGGVVNGDGNAVYGYRAATELVDGNNNLVMGAYAWNSAFDGEENVVLGYRAGYSGGGDYNVLIGSNSGYNIGAGIKNVIIGYQAGNSNSFGSENAFYGNQAGYNINSSFNTAIGSSAGSNYSYNEGTFVGWEADVSTSGLSNVIVIGANASIAISNACRIGSASVSKLGIGKSPAASSILDFQVTTARLTTGGVWTNASDERIKDQKTQLDKEDILAKINDLKIERWHYLADAENITHIGPYAQDFYKQFQVGDDSTISTIDPAGVALIGIQALSIQQESTTDQLQMLTAENALLRQQLDNLSAIVGALQQDVSMCCASSGSTMGSSALAPALGQNIPNPFTGSTRIPYSIPSGNHTAKMLITHMGTGQIILDEEIDSSKTSMEISAGTLSSGTYSYSLIVDGRIIDTRVMVVQQ